MSEDNYGLPGVSLGPVSMPLLGFGTWQISDDDVTAAVGTALEVGYRHLDTATGYANEAGIGRALAAAGLPRDEVFVTTKLPPDHGGRERRTIEESLTKLGLDHVDLWLVHWPPGGVAAPEVWEQVVKAQQDGLATSVGVSNYSLAQIDELTSAVGVTPAVNQIKWGPLLHDVAEVDGLRERGVVLQGYSPLKATDLDDPVLAGIAEEHGVSPAQVVIAWHVAHGFVVIPKSSRPERIRANAEAVRVPLSVEQVAAVDGLARS
ncbi:Aldo/keto reductase [Friedmanniella luteola]|uniref:Aldo/keto reductase n=1 Tax=Friedmanniella luteola TaxID=546871 RepID=A0A1H1QSV1_9ACTN|nr:aldo/keto reductase [Friedmanniella luteola]SDS26572.1 Aldo/keto reductase [Friedmanniella luteola]